MSLQTTLAWRPLTPIEGATLHVAATEAVGPLVLDVLCFLAQSLNI